MLVGMSRRLWAQGNPPLRYLPLARPVLVPLAELSAPWRARSFVAEGVTVASAAKPNQPIRISGMVVRTAAGDEPDKFQAVSVLCPHEHCDCDFVADPSRLPDEVVQEIGHPVKQPVYLCPCHNSTFKVEDGERLAGPAPRGRYRFRVTAVSATAVEIGEVEEDVLIFG
jgi:nitrite reductase/ring-hydroxylating ferredoxin subunit